MLENQTTVDKFNQLGKEKITAAKNIQTVKFQFKQAAQNVKTMLECEA